MLLEMGEFEQHRAGDIDPRGPALGDASVDDALVVDDMEEAASTIIFRW